MKRILCSLISGLCLACAAQAQVVPEVINYQGRLVDGDKLVTAEVEMVIRLYNQLEGGNLLFEDAARVQIVDGLYSTYIGDDIMPGALTLPMALHASAVFVELTVDGVTLSPREQMTSVPYAHMAAAVPPGAIYWWMLADGAVDETKIAHQAVSAEHLQLGSVTGEKILNGTIVSEDLSDNTITSAKIADGTILSVDLADDAVSGRKIEDGTIGSDDLAVNAVTSLNIEDASIGLVDIGGNGAATGQFLKWNGTTWEPATVTTGDAALAGYSENGAFADAPSSAGVNAIAMGNAAEVNGNNSVVGGGFANVIDSANAATIAGGYQNNVGLRANEVSIGGGVGNVVETDAGWSTISGGKQNLVCINSHSSSIGGGIQNTVSEESKQSTIGGGVQNVVSRYSAQSTIAGGKGNTIDEGAGSATIGGGEDNMAERGAGWGVVGGGRNNKAGYNTNCATVPGGKDNEANGSYSLAAGRRAKAEHQGSFVWADSQDADFASTAANQFRLRAAGGVDIQGDVNVSGTVTYGGNPKATFPRPAYDSGWVSLDYGETKRLTHNLGGDVNDYVVDFSHRDYANGIHNRNIGGNSIWSSYNDRSWNCGAWWRLDGNTTLTVTKGDDEQRVEQVRVRIWIYQ